MKIVLDTNVLLVSISDVSPYHWIWRAFESGEFTLCFSTEILNEYAEIIEQHMGHNVSEQTMNAIIKHRFTERVEKYFLWNLIHQDPDDNKFVDCAIACNADYLVTEDRHFNALKQIPFPKVEVVNVEYFRDILEV